MRPDTWYLTHARLVLPDAVLEDAAVTLADGRITAVCPGHGGRGREVSLAGRFLLPGLVDLHSDAIEREVEPRPNVTMPYRFALAHLDRLALGCGITTLYHALSFAGMELGLRRDDAAQSLARLIASADATRLIDHRAHCRYELTNGPGLERVEALVREGVASMVSLMDHTPGQGQFSSWDAYRGYLRGRYGSGDAQLAALERDKATSEAEKRRRAQRVAAWAGAKGVPLASHDDDTEARIEALAALGGRIAEFPINPEAADAARRRGLHVVVGAPNLLRGVSQSGGMLARDAVARGLVTCLCSDFLPQTLLPAAFAAARDPGLPLHDAVRLVTAGPAEAAGLSDRGAIAPGMRADLLAVGLESGQPVVAAAWVGGALAGTLGLEAGRPMSAPQMVGAR